VGVSRNAVLTLLADSHNDGLPDELENGRNPYTKTTRWTIWKRWFGDRVTSGVV
jgi:hypothetical protein